MFLSNRRSQGKPNDPTADPDLSPLTRSRTASLLKSFQIEEEAIMPSELCALVRVGK